MAAKSSREELKLVPWNPVTGCTKASPGCVHCYAERFAKRLKAMANPRYANEFALTLHPNLLDVPLKWRNPKRIFVNSMSDLFHEEVPLSFIQDVFSTIGLAKQHVFQILTKRADRLAELASDLPWPDNLLMGVTVEHQDYAWRVDRLRVVQAAVRFLCCEPLLGALDLDLKGIHWVIAGGESGPGARPMSLDWARSLRNQCLEARVPFFLKQLGGVHSMRNKDKAILDGRLWQEMPKVLLDREDAAVSQGRLI